MRGDSLVKKEAGTNRITIGKEVEGSEINIADKGSKDRILSGVKEATKSNEAINKGQFDKGLKELSESIQSDDSAVVHYDKKDDENGVINYVSVTFGKGKASPPIAPHNVADGTIADGSHDVINGSQLYSLNQTLASYLGGGAEYNEGLWGAPIFKVTTFNEDGSSEERSYLNVSEAFAGVSSSFTKLHNEISDNSDNIGQHALLWSDEDRAFVALHGTGDQRSKSKLKSLLDGDISEGFTDAITGHQFYSLHQTLAMYLGGGAIYEGGTWHAPEFKVAQFNVDGSSSDKDLS
ncbi:hypothetical protein [Bartonella sp. TT121SHDZB]|uniref:hypothetical protein n=1 Tax=Bartonella sp. TT121SHDZB TaxID=3243580 RepID=UPI0035CEB353